jgi:hypothetical protein
MRQHMLGLAYRVVIGVVVRPGILSTRALGRHRPVASVVPEGPRRLQTHFTVGDLQNGVVEVRPVTPDSNVFARLQEL